MCAMNSTKLLLSNFQNIKDILLNSCITGLLYGSESWHLTLRREYELSEKNNKDSSKV
jgi:hypothetical protein